jgi:hypothetical protein
MKADDADKKLDSLIHSAIGRDSLSFDFQQWQRDHQQHVNEFRSEVAVGRNLGASISGLVHGILATRISKLAIAAAILLTAALVVSRFTESLDGTTAAYAKVTRAVRNVPWMHVQYTGYLLDEKGNRISKEGALDTEIWYSFNAQTVIQKYHGGHITYNDYGKHQVYTYNPTSHRIILTALGSNRLPFTSDSPWSWLEGTIQRITTPPGGDVTRRTEHYKGQQVEVFEIVSAVEPGVATIHDKVFVDRTTFLPIAEERTYINTNTGTPQEVDTGAFDYPEQGPADIYALGLSRDIPTINSQPLPEWQEIRDVYRSHHYQAAMEKYIVVVTEAMAIVGNPVTAVDICYAEGARLRTERHFPIGPGPVGEQWAKQATEFGNTFDSILKWSRAYRAHGAISISLYEGKHWYEARRDDHGSWSMTEQTSPREPTKEDLWNLAPVADLGWPEIRDQADIIQDDYARENHLIRVEAQRGVFWLNPDRDYICQRRITTDGRMEEVTEFGQTEGGRWYPKKIDSSGLGHTMYLEANPKYPDGIFDPNRLPRAGR